MENQEMKSSSAFDPMQFIDELYKVLSGVTISGADNIHRMGMVLNGLSVLYNREKERKEQEAEKEQQERQEI